MSAADADIAAQMVAQGLCTKVRSSCGRVWDTDRGRVFVKMGTGGSSANQSMSQYEAEGLARTATAAPSLLVPTPWLVGATADGQGFIAMDYLDLGWRGGVGYINKLGAGLAELHLAPAQHKTFGFPMDGCCGALDQPNNATGRQMTWVEFWREFRLGHQLAHYQKAKPDDVELHEMGAQLSARLDELFSMLNVEDIRPSLLHGDLWSGNYSAVNGSDKSAIYDPACYYGHYEADHGINYMFGGGEAFRNEGYVSLLPPAPGAEKRKMLYELHHHLNHLNIFGEGYRSGCIGLMRQILRR